VSNKNKVIFAVMWAGAIAATLLIWFAQPDDSPEATRPPPASDDVRRPDDDPAPAERRTGIPVSAPEEGPPRMFRNDRRHTGRSPYRGPNGAELAWRFDSEDRINGQAVVAADGTIYFGSHDRHLYALSPHGTERWKRDLGGAIFATPLVDAAGNVYCGSDGDQFASFTSSGELRFRLATEGDADTGVVQSPTGAIHFAAGKYLYTVDTDGNVAWRFEAREKIFSTPAVDEDGTVYFGSQDDHFYAVAADGRMRWAYETGDDNDASAVIGDDGTLYFGSDDHHVYALSRDGALVWSADLEGYVRGPLALGVGGAVLAVTYGPRPRLVSLDGGDGRLVWFFPVTVTDSSEVGVHSGPLVDREGDVYFGAHDDYLYAITAAGEMRWIFAARGDVDGPPVLTPDGTLLFGSDDGSLYAIRTVGR
jgi:outer membrane protein assembly factor BamB